MAILKIMNGIPLYSKEEDAVAWAASRGLVGYHTHNHLGKTGYMGGISHNQAVINNSNIVIEEDINFNILEEDILNTTSSLGLIEDSDTNLNKEIITKSIDTTDISTSIKKEEKEEEMNIEKKPKPSKKY